MRKGIIAIILEFSEVNPAGRVGKNFFWQFCAPENFHANPKNSFDNSVRLFTLRPLWMGS